MKKNLLVIDWDYFFPVDPYGKNWQLFDWGHSEGFSFMQNHIWTIRAADFDRAGVARPQVNDEWRDFWERFTFHEDTVLFYADSNSQAYHEDVRGEGPYAQVWLYDAHHDSGYETPIEEIIKSGKLSCEDWMVGYRLTQQAELHVRYPRWKAWAMEAEPEPIVPVDRQVDDFGPNPLEFHTVMVCRSSAWVPPWGDGKFWDFITDAPVNEIYSLGSAEEPRVWSEDDVTQHAETIRQLEQGLGS